MSLFFSIELNSSYRDLSMGSRKSGEVRWVGADNLLLPGLGQSMSFRTNKDQAATRVSRTPGRITKG